MRRLSCLLIGWALIPVAVSVTLALGGLMRLLWSNGLGGIPATAWALATGFAAWVVIYFSMPRPVRAYVLAHELTHAVWGWVMGARVRRIQLRGTGGSVQLSRTNWLITLAPYFCPLYTLIVILAYGLIGLFADVRPYAIVWASLIGVSWGFHVTFTLSSLALRQTDIEEYGRTLSYSIIYIFNVLFVALWLVAATPCTLFQFIRLMGHSAGTVAGGIWHALRWLLHLVNGSP